MLAHKEEIKVLQEETILMDEIKSLRANLSEYEIQLRQSKKDHQVACQECAKLKEDISLLEGREKMLEKEYKKDVKALHEETMLMDEIKSLRANLSEYEIQLRQSKKDHQVARQECAKLKEDISLLEGREKMLEKEYKEEIKALQEKTELIDETKSLRANLSEYEVQLRQAKKEHQVAHMEIAKLKEDISLLEGREKMLELEYKEEIKALQEKLR